MLPTADRLTPDPAERAGNAARLLRSGELGRRLVNLAQLAAAAHMARSAEQIVRDADGAGRCGEGARA